jgi:hypothetical protein
MNLVVPSMLPYSKMVTFHIEMMHFPMTDHANK